MKRLTYYNPQIVAGPANHHLPGMEKFSSFFKIFNANVVCIDRTGALKLPVSTHSLFPMPSFRKINDSLENICDRRAKELLNKAEESGMKLHVFYSGGIDSTLLLVSLLKNATPSQKSLIVVLMSEDSIRENPRFYAEHIRPQLAMEPSSSFPYRLGTRALFVGAEHNDQLFGSDKVAGLISQFGPGIIHKTYSRDTFFTFIDGILNNRERTGFYLDLFERLRDRAPVDIHSNFLFLWWINFSLKWQSVFTRMLVYTAPRNAAKIDLKYLQENFMHFYNTEDFQLWSMNNTDKRIKDEWRTYKWPCKDIIYDYTKDAEYRDNKLKVGSLFFLLLERGSFNFMDEDARLLHTLEPQEYFLPDNDFV